MRMDKSNALLLILPIQNFEQSMQKIDLYVWENVESNQKHDWPKHKIKNQFH